ncbi:MAG: MmgE/PrpD family protein [Acidaminococcaceae bacterium]|nr:MmgE/PrpD family protein [Acidaminococcaceae bacterium]
MEDIIQSISKFITITKYEDLNDEVVSCAKERVLDALSAVFAGARLWEYNDSIIESFIELGLSGNSIIIGRSEMVAYSAAAAINGAYAHSVELDDGHSNAGMHAGAVVVPTALALAERFKNNGREVILSIVLGYEIAYRFAKNMSPAIIYKGFHPSAICGTIAAATVSASLLKLNVLQTANALSLSALLAAGLMEITRSGQAAKGAIVGHAAFTGINAAIMAKNGFTAPEASFTGENGLLQAMSTDVNPEKIIEGLGRLFEIKDTYVKLYPTCRHTHAPIECALMLCKEHDILAKEIEHISIGTYPIAHALTGSQLPPEDTQHARFSTPYCVATVILNRNLGINDFDKMKIEEEERRKLISKISVYIDDYITAKFPKERGVRVCIKLKDGRCFEKDLFNLKGDPKNPVSYDELCRKFENMGIISISIDKIDTICQRVKNFENIIDINSFMQLLKNKD